MTKVPSIVSLLPADKEALEPSYLTDQIKVYEYLSKRFGTHILQGRSAHPGDILLTSNDYLDLAGHPAILRALSGHITTRGREQLRSDVYRHGENPQRDFERKVAKWTGMPDAVLTQSGWNANVGLVQALAGPKIPVYLDMKAHMSLWEGANSAGARIRPFKHNDAGSLENMLKRHGPGVVAVDSVYSTEGSICPLQDIVEVSSRYGALLIVDESHSLGIYGVTGAGLVATLGLTRKVPFITASLSKAFAARGGIVMGSSRHLEYFRYTARPAIFSSGIMEHEAVVYNATLGIIARADDRRIKLAEKSRSLRMGLDRLGYHVTTGQSHIIALQSGDEARTIVLRDALESRGVFGSVFCWPATGKGRALVRFSVNSGLSEAALGKILVVCEEIRGEIELASWAGNRSLRKKAG